MAEDGSAHVIHWFVVTFNGFVMGFIASLVFAFGIVLAGAGYEFWHMWRDRTYRPRGFWAFWWIWSWIGTLAERCLHVVGSVPAGELRNPDGGVWVADDRHVLVIIHGTFGALTKHDWRRWDRITAAFPLREWQVLRYGWSGGNSGAARQRAAARLAELVHQIREKGNASQRVVLVGHSHGGSVAYEAARNGEVDAVVAIATPFLGLWEPMRDRLKRNLEQGMMMRFFAPVGLLIVAAFMAGTDSQPLSWFGQALLLAVPVVVVFFSSVAIGVRDRNLLQEPRTPVKAPVMVIHAKADTLMDLASELDSSARAVSQDSRRMYALAHRIQMMTRLPEQAPPSWKLGASIAFYVSSAYPWFSWRWLKEACLFAGVGALLIDVSAMLFPKLAEGNQAALAPWVFPSTEYFLAKTILYAALFAPVFLVGARLLTGRWLPSWHRSSLLLGRYWAAAARLSQLYAFKAGLSGFGGMTFHFGDARITGTPHDCERLMLQRIGLGTVGLRAHSNILVSAECADIVARSANAARTS